MEEFMGYGARSACGGAAHPAPVFLRSLAALFLAASICLLSGPALAASTKITTGDAGESNEPKAVKPKPTEKQRKMFEASEIKQPASFDECVRVALIQSPNLLKSSLEIEVKKLDEGDAMSQYIPTLVIGTSYYLRNPNQDIINPSPAQMEQKPYTFTFSAGGWNPVQTFFDNKAKEGLTKLAIEAHLEAINIGLKELATLYLQIGFSQKLIDLNTQRTELARQNLQFVQTRVSLGYAKPLDMEIANIRVDMAQAEREKYEATKATLVSALKSMLGMPASQKLEMDVSNFTEQVMRGYAPAMATPEKAVEASYDMRKAEIERDLQRKSIILAYVKYLPQLGFSLSTPDPVNQSSGSRWGLYPAITLNLSLDWLTKTRDVSRQQFKLEQLLTSMRVTGLKIENTLQTAQINYRGYDSASRFSRSKVELARLTEQQSLLQFQGSQIDADNKGKVEYDKLLTDRLAVLEAKEINLTDELKRDTALLDLKFLSGDLRRQYVNVTPMEINHQ
jgi:outer membrane protein TolC